MVSARSREREGLSHDARPRAQKRVSVIKKSEQWLAALNAISGLTTQSMDIRQVLAFAADKTMDVMDVDAVRIYLLNDGADVLSLQVGRGLSQRFMTAVRRVKLSEGLNGVVAATGKPMMVEDATVDPLLGRQAVIAEGIRSQLIVPLQSGGKVVGTLCVARRTRHKFYRVEVSLLSSIGNVIGAAIGNASLHQEMKQTLAQLRQSEEKYRSLFEGAYDAIWVHDLDGNMLAANKACEELTGYSSDELMTNNICEMMPVGSRACLETVEEKLLTNRPVDHRCEGEVITKANGRAIVQVATSLISQEGQPAGFQHCARDVTDERQLQENLRYYLQQVTRAQEEERKRIARELHDEILQRLIAISRQLEKVTSSDALWEESVQSVRGFKKQIELAVQEMRRFSRDLRPSILDDLGLLAALDLLGDDLEKRGIVAGFKVIGESRRLMPEVEVMLFRIAQEAATNIWRHAQASQAELAIEFRRARVRLSVRDNGSGFDPPRNAGDLAKSGKLGLTGMQERAKLLGGSLTLDSCPGKGTIVTVEVPVQA